MNKINALLGVVLFCGVAQLAQAADWYGELGYAQGGDTFDVTVVNDNGSELDKELSMGGGLNLAIGGTHSVTDSMSMVYSFGHKVDNVVAGDDEVSFRRWPLMAIASFNVGDTFQLGGGLTYELNPKLDLKDTGQGSHSADNALGLALQMGWHWGGFSVFLRHTQIDYKFSGQGGSVTLDGNNTGLHMGFVW